MHHATTVIIAYTQSTISRNAISTCTKHASRGKSTCYICAPAGDKYYFYTLPFTLPRRGGRDRADASHRREGATLSLATVQLQVLQPR
jgi:hypothetical protein